jgi:hypothetical protein
MDMSQLLRALGLQQAYQSYQQNIGQPFANVAGPFGRGLLGLDRPEYGEEQAYRTGQAVGNMPAVSAPVGAFKALAQVPGLLEAAGVAPAIFIGPKAKSWNKASAEAFEALEKAGATNKDAYLQTGTFRSPDGMLRQEISDANAKIADDVFFGIKENQEFKGQMSKALGHEDLYKAYPEVSEIPSGFYASKDPEGSFDRATGTITVGGPGTTSQKKVALHELMHAIQQKEGFAGGGKPSSLGIPWEQQQKQAKQIYENSLNSYGDPILEELFKGQTLKPWESLTSIEKIQWIEQAQLENYRRLAGEAEARAVERRMKMSTDQLKNAFPLESYDVPIEQIIVRILGQK